MNTNTIHNKTDARVGTSLDLTRPAALYLGSDPATARAQGSRRFATAFAAIRFAMEQAAPVSLRGALLATGEHRLDGSEIGRLYRGDSRFRRVMPPEVAALDAA